MRLLILDLERYGPFSGRSLTFRPDAKLHVVYGPNEAGKSSSLAAITDLLFGIERQTSYDFLHEGKELRIGATITARDGRHLTFRRRKGNKNTLIDASDRPLGDDALLPFLGNLSREVFCHAFGLSPIGLRQGAEEMLKSDGDVGASLFAAASGLRGLTELRRNLDDEAAGIFALRPSKDRRFYQALERYEDAHKAIRELEVKAGDWKSLNDAIDEDARRLGEMEAQQRANAKEQARLSRLKRVAPLVRFIDRDLAGLSALGPLPEMPAGFAGRLQASLEAVAKAEETHKRACADEAKATKDHAGITVDEAIIAQAGEVLSLFSEVGAYATNRRDLPRIQAEADDYRGRLAELAVRLGLEDTAAVETRQPADAAQGSVRSLIGEGRKLVAEVSRHTDALAQERSSLAQMERQRLERGGLIDPRPLQEKLNAFGPVLKQLEKRVEIERTIETEKRALKEAAGRLAPPIIEIDALAAASLPGPETIVRFRKEFDALAKAIGRESDRVSASSETLTTIEARLQELASGRPVPTTEAIATKRRQRDEKWRSLRTTLLGGTDALAGASLVEAITDFERHSSEADGLADDAANDAGRVAAHSTETGRLAEERRKHGAAQDQLLDLEAKKQELTDAWTMVWAPARIVPLPPAEMSGWILAASGLLERREKVQGLRDNLASLDAAAHQIEPALIALADEAGLPRVEGLDAGLLSARIEDRIRSIRESWDQARDLDTSIRNTTGRIADLVIAQAEAVDRHDKWLERWRPALPAIGLPATATPDEAEPALGAWKDVPGTIRERDNRARRVAGMQRNINNFEVPAMKLMESLAPDLAKMPGDVAMKVLNDRLSEAKATETRRNVAAKRLAEEAAARTKADGEFREAEVALAGLAGELPAGFDPAEFLTRVGERDKLFDGLDQLRSQLIAQADGHSEENLRSDLASFDGDSAEGALKALAAEDERLDHEAREVFADRDRAVRRRAELERGVGAEVAAQQRRNAEAELAILAREWAVFKLGSLLIGHVVDRHRASQQDPLIARAGVLFETLTGGAFTGLGQDYDEEDVPRLVGHRKSGGIKTVPGMSDGTRDQLYLALRLAYLEDYSSRAEPTPFIGDDLFTTFDDARTAHALAALAAIGERVQPILFTHHLHVVEIARSKMGAHVDVVDLS
jgi:chromosome segregation protein